MTTGRGRLADELEPVERRRQQRECVVDARCVGRCGRTEHDLGDLDRRVERGERGLAEHRRGRARRPVRPRLRGRRVSAPPPAGARTSSRSSIVPQASAGRLAVTVTVAVPPAGTVTASGRRRRPGAPARHRERRGLRCRRSSSRAGAHGARGVLAVALQRGARHVRARVEAGDRLRQRERVGARRVEVRRPRAAVRVVGRAQGQARCRSASTCSTSADSNPGLRRRFSCVTMIAADVACPDAVTPLTVYSPAPEIHVGGVRPGDRLLLGGAVVVLNRHGGGKRRSGNPRRR